MNRAATSTTAPTGHELCTAVPWENTIVGLGDNDSFHPNTAGYAKYASDLKNHLGS